MKSKSKAIPPSVPEVVPKPKTKTPGLKGGINKAAAWVKKNPALAALLIGGVVLLAIILMRKSTGITAARADSGDGEDVMGDLGGLGGLGLESYEPPPLSDFVIPEFFLPEIPPLYTEPAYTYWYPEEEVAQSSTFYPEDELDREYYLERAHELEALAGGTEDSYFRGLIADMARLTGLGSLTEEDWETEERLRREWEERQNGGQTTTQRRTTQPTITAVSPLQYLINKLKSALTSRATTPSTISERRYTLPSTHAQPSTQPSTQSPTQPSTPIIGPSATPTYDTGTFSGQLALFQSVVSGRQTEPTTPTYHGGLQEF